MPLPVNQQAVRFSTMFAILLRIRFMCVAINHVNIFE